MPNAQFVRMDEMLEAATARKIAFAVIARDMGHSV